MVDKTIKAINNYKEEVVKEIEKMSSIAQETAASTEEVSASTEEQVASAEQLEDLAGELKEVVVGLNKSLEAFKI